MLGRLLGWRLLPLPTRCQPWGADDGLRGLCFPRSERPAADCVFSFFIYKRSGGDSPLGGSGKCLAQKLQFKVQTAMPFTQSVSLSISLKHMQIIPGDAGLGDGLASQGRVSIWTQLTLDTFCEGPSCASTVGRSAPSLAPTL